MRCNDPLPVAPVQQPPYYQVRRLPKGLYVSGAVAGAASLVLLSGAVSLPFFGLAAIDAFSAFVLAPVLLFLLWVPCSLASIYASIVAMVFLHKQWSCIQDGYARTSPGTAVGYMFIPFFNFYWVFQAYYGFAVDFNAYVDRYNLVAPRLPTGLILANIIVGFGNGLAFLPGVGFFVAVAFAVLNVIVTIRVCDALNAIAEYRTTPYSGPLAAPAGVVVAGGAAPASIVVVQGGGGGGAAQSAPAQTSAQPTQPVPQPVQPSPARPAPAVAPVQAGAPAVATGTDVASQVGQAYLGAVRTLKGPLRLSGVLCLSAGIIGSITVLAAPVGIVLILLGVSMLGAAGRVQDFFDTGDPRSLPDVWRRMRTFALTSGVLFVIGVLPVAIAVVALAITAAMGLLPYTLKYYAIKFNEWAATMLP
ncbi:hypothetical protein FJY69_08935 [candidate division WOR-3 bacterium]|nr:hypothetical protein [candidate division WOR-3 bacterium]